MELPRGPLLDLHAADGARLTAFGEWGVAEHFGDADAEYAAGCDGVALYDLAHHGSFTLVGPDARRFCNGMFTNNIRNLPVGQVNASAMVDDKARVQGLLRTCATGPEAFLVLLEGVPPEAFAARYEKYIIFDDVEMTDISSEVGLLSVQGPEAGATLVRAGLPVPAAGGHEEREGVRVITHARTVAGGFDIVVPRAALVQWWATLRASGARPAGLDAQEALRIDAGLPRWPVDMSDRSLLHELNLVPTHASFEKGCYIGQEVINRIDVMGQVNKKIRGLRFETGALPAHGAEVRLGDEVVGTVLSRSAIGGAPRALALLRKAAWSKGTRVSVTAGEGSMEATVSDLPFTRG
jgi:folate-binding protein YgfZ